ncbi:MAG TPA: hypothetical protein VIO60_10315 [Rectinemataceae bacterium]
MATQADRERDCELKLWDSGYELLDIGRDFSSEEHVYYILERSNGSLAMERLLTLDDVEGFISALN